MSISPGPRMMAVGAIAAIAGMLVAGCTAAPPPSPKTTPTPACSASPVTLFSEFTEAFNAHDAAQLADLFTEDANFVNIFGQFMPGRDGIESGHADAFDSRIAVADLNLDKVKVVDVDSEVVVMYGFWTLKQPDGADAALSVPDGSGILTGVAECAGREWRFAAVSNTRVTPAPS